MSLFTITEQRDFVVFRMPKTLFALDNLWEQIEAAASDVKVSIKKVGLYATVEELDSILSDIDWLWKSHIPKGFMTMYAGEAGIGKSLTVLDVARIVTTGDFFPMSEERCKRGKVFWIDTEMKQQLLNIRSKTIGVDRSRLLIPAIDGNLLAKLDAGNELHKQHIISVIEAEQPDLLVVDSLGHSHSRGENRIEEIRPVMDFLSGVSRDYGIATIVVHHLNKPKEEATEVSMSRVRGSTDIVATPVVIYAIEKGGEDDIKIRQIKNNIGKQQPSLSAKLLYSDADKDEVSAIEYSLYKAPPPKRSKKEVCAEWVHDILMKEKNGVPLIDIVEQGMTQGFTRGNIYACRDVLGDQLGFGGTGNKAIWYLTTFSDTESIEKIRKSKNEKSKNK